MRFLLFDRVTSLETGRRIETVKCFSLEDEHLRDHFRLRPLVPAALVLEAMLQSLGWLVMTTHGFRLTPFFSMLEDATLPGELAPGQRLDITGELVSTNAKGSMGRAEARIDGQVVATLGRVLYGHYPAPDPVALRASFPGYEAPR